LGRGEVRVIPVPASIWLLWINAERILVLRADGVGRAGRVQELFVVAEDDKEEESGETEFDEEGDNVGPSASVPGSIAPCAQRFSALPQAFFSQRDSHLAASTEFSLVLVTGPQIPQFCNPG